MASAQQGRVPPSRVLLVACTVAFLAFLDATVVTVAFPSIREPLAGTSIGALSWVLNAYNIVLAAFLIVFGRITDLLGRRCAFLAGLVLFTLASALCGAAPTVAWMVAARALQALGAALLVRRRPFGDWLVPTHSLARGSRMQAGLVRAYGADTVLEGFPRQLHAVSTELVSRSRQVHRRDSLVDAVAASVRLPVLFAPIPDRQGRLLVDGGVLDNLPVDLLLERAEGPVVAISIARGGAGPRDDTHRHGTRRATMGPARVPALGETLRRTMMIGSGGAVTEAVALGAIVVTPATLGVGLVQFHPFDRMVAAGRAAARDLLERTGGDLSAGCSETA